eukprot:g4345.t1
MANSAQTDPYVFYEGKTKRNLEEVEGWHAKWKDALEGTNTATDKGFRKTSKKLSDSCDAVRRLLGDMDKMISVLSKQRSKFPHVDDAELDRRKSFVASSRGKLRAIMEDMQSPRTRRKLDDDKRKALELRDNVGSSAETQLPSSRGRERESASNLLERGRRDQRLLMEEQDQILDSMEVTIQNVGGMATAMGSELDEQKIALNSLDEDLDRALQRMNKVEKTMGKLLKTSNRCTMYLVLFLSVIVVILFLLVIYT